MLPPPAAFPHLLAHGCPVRLLASMCFPQATQLIPPRVSAVGTTPCVPREPVRSTRRDAYYKHRGMTWIQRSLRLSTSEQMVSLQLAFLNRAWSCSRKTSLEFMPLLMLEGEEGAKAVRRDPRRPLIPTMQHISHP